MIKLIKAVIMFITKDTISPNFNPWLIQSELDINKRF